MCVHLFLWEGLWVCPSKDAEPMAITYPKEVAQCHRETDGDSRTAWIVSMALISGGKDAEHQLQGQEELYGHRLASCCVVVELGTGWELAGFTDRSCTPLWLHLPAHQQ